jgi:ribosomal protein S12 methylthiotransferase
MRGLHKSRTIESLVTEAQFLARKGVKELILIAQELTYYGLDIYKKRSLDVLLNSLSEVEGIEWIRLHYAYPSQFPLELLDTMRENPKICNYLDIPLQHISDKVLKDMKRNITMQQTQDLVDKIRERVPNIALRTTMLTGFPTESEQDFEMLCAFIEKNRFDRLGVFTYSHEENTSAHKFDDVWDDEEKNYRQQTLMEIQSGISYELNQNKIGQTFKVILDRTENGIYYGRTEFDSPEVDNEVVITTENYLRLGDFVDVTITDATEFDLEGKVNL